MKPLLLLIITLFFSGNLLASAIESFNQIEVNPQGSTAHKVTAAIHLVTDVPFTDQEEILAAREVIAIALSALTTRELTSNGGIETAKYHILKQIKANGLIGGNTIQNVYITDMVVSFVGANRASVYVSPKIKP